ncbi:MAG TPA: EAL domain-containing protein [Chloroflexota bacterium]|nr:EAL domain-containing protein [Chloroflexota bacterium]
MRTDRLITPSTFSCWDSSATLTPARRILETVRAAGVEQVILADPQGTIRLQVGDAAAHAAQSETAARGFLQVSFPILLRGQLAAVIQASGLPQQRRELEQLLRTMAVGLEESWSAVEEIENLAGEILHAYEELHLLYGLGDILTRKLNVATDTEVIDLVLEEILNTVNADWGEINLPDFGVLCHQDQREADTASGTYAEQPQLLQVSLQSGGESLGSITLARSRGAEPFSSMDSKLLEGVATLVANTIRSAKLYEELRLKSEALGAREGHLRAVLENVAEGIITVDEVGSVRSFNPAAEQIFGFTAGEVIGRQFRTLIAESGNLLVAPRTEDLGQSDPPATCPSVPRREVLGYRKDGKSVALDLAISNVRIDSHPFAIVSVRDITERKRWEDVLRYQALHDTLTNLPNRILLHDRLQMSITVGTQVLRPFALLLLDLDHFKEVNDTFGHQYGDILLKEAASRLAGVLRPSDTIARLGGDEFGVILPNTDEISAATIASRILSAQEKPFVVEGNTLHIGTSIGIALFPGHGTTADALLRYADVAMYEAKRSQAGYRVYAPDQDRHAPSRLALLSELRTAIDDNQLILHFQPMADFRNCQIVRVEALVRWLHPERGLVPPADFIETAERAGLIGPLSRWVIDAALRACGEWQQLGHDVAVSVNLSAQNLHDPNLPNVVATSLRAWGVTPSSLRVEITESTLMADPVRALDTLTRLNVMGVQISIDDFGTGYSSLAHLKRLPADELKIDKSFVLHMGNDEDDAAIVRSTIGLGHDLGMSVVAEGVESHLTLELLDTLGCDVAQGFFVGRPMPASDLIRWLEQKKIGNSSFVHDEPPPAPTTRARTTPTSPSRAGTRRRFHVPTPP